MQKEPTGAERYFQKRLEDPEYAKAYRAARARIDRIDAIVRMLDEQRIRRNLSKAELGRRSGLEPASVRRLFSAAGSNPTISTVVALASAMDLELQLTPVTD